VKLLASSTVRNSQFFCVDLVKIPLIIKEWIFIEKFALVCSQTKRVTYFSVTPLGLRDIANTFVRTISLYYYTQYYFCCMSSNRDGNCINLKRRTERVTFRAKKSNFYLMFDMAVLILNGSAVT
jgi:hypothetical protein